MGYQRFNSAFDKCQAQFSQPVKISYYQIFGEDTYDDSPEVVKVGSDVWLSGTLQSLNTADGSIDSNLVEQGKLINNDSKLYLHGSITLTGSFYQMRVQLGSPTGEQYTLIPNGALGNSVNAQSIYKKVYIRRFSQETISGLIIDGSGTTNYLLDGGDS